MNEIVQNGIGIVRTPKGIAVGGVEAEALANNDAEMYGRRSYGITTSIGGESFTVHQPEQWRIEVWYHGQVIKEELVSPKEPWRDFYPDRDMMQCGVKVFDGYRLLAELEPPAFANPMPFMVPRLEQVHITESYVESPPALHITDGIGAVWTLGMGSPRPKEQSPHGEFAFEVLRNGYGTGVIASRIAMRSGKVKAFTKNGWLVWSQTGRTFI